MNREAAMYALRLTAGILFIAANVSGGDPRWLYVFCYLALLLSWWSLHWMWQGERDRNEAGAAKRPNKKEV